MSTAIFNSDSWPADVAQLLDDHHLVVLSDMPAVRMQFADRFCDYLKSILDTQVVEIDGAQVTSLHKFCAQLGRQAPGAELQPSMDSVARLLRHWPGSPKRLYLMWRDADASLDADLQLFSRLVNALCAVAVEHEHLNPGRLMLQRAVFIGNSKLGAYAEDRSGQFSRWLDADDDIDDSLFWEAQSCVERPPVLTYRVDA